MRPVLQSCKTVSKNCRATKPALDPNKSSLQLLTDEYIQKWGNYYKLESKWWGDKELTWKKAIERAWKSRLSNEKMHSHQCRVAHKLPEGLRIALADKTQPEDFKDFQSVYDWVQSIVIRVKGLANTTAYDVAQRLGAWLGLEPTVVYLHAGTADGAKKFGIKGHSAPLSLFPKEIQLLGATHAENFLCIYKNKISDSTVNS
ncbi:hypothetical protein [Picosynechococcus sp. NKBG042902]|uniref:hypothetical protein n=1 Tax=Picosynechococcus sp. NKBG042902 TaxID=490193 RepID=UPI0004AB2804|nr:hypothetical protein [Picosynechococcus sp. NKBG042902]